VEYNESYELVAFQYRNLAGKYPTLFFSTAKIILVSYYAAATPD
jgi:hypothetical protein